MINDIEMIVKIKKNLQKRYIKWTFLISFIDNDICI